MRGFFSGEITWDEGFAEYVPWRLEVARLWLEGEFPFFTSRVFAGMPLFATSYSGVLYPPNAIYAIMDPVRAANLLWAGHGFAGALGMFLLLRSWRLASFAAYVGALFFISNTFHLIHQPHISMRESALLAPWVVWGARRLLGAPGPGSALLFATLFALQIAAGYQQLVLFTGVWVALEWILAMRLSKRFLLGSLWLAVGTMAGAFLMAGQVTTALAHVPYTLRTEMTLDNWQSNSFLPLRIMQWISPRALGTPSRAFFGPELGGEVWITLPLLAFGLAVSAAVALLLHRSWRRGPRRRPVIGYWLAFGAVFVLGAGSYHTLNEDLFTISPFNLFRVPARWMFLGMSFVAVLAGFGTHHLLRLAPWQRFRWALGGMALWITALVLAFVYLFRPWPWDSGLAWSSVIPMLLHDNIGPDSPVGWHLRNMGLWDFGGLFDRKVGTVFLSVLLAASLAFARISPRLVGTAFALLLAFEFWGLHLNTHHNPAEHDRAIVWRKHALLRMVEPESITRIYSPTPDGQGRQRLALPDNTHLYLGLSSLGGYCPLFHERLFTMLGLSQTGVGWRDRGFYENPAPLEQMAVSHLLYEKDRLYWEMREPVLALEGTHYETLLEKDGVRLAKLSLTRPRWDFAASWTWIPEHQPERALPIVYDNSRPVEDLSVAIGTPFPESLPPQGTPLSRGTVSVLEDRDMRKSVTVQVDGDAILLLRDAHWNGWEYRVGDGPWRPTLLANGLFHAMVVPAGEHAVHLRYEAPGWAQAVPAMRLGIGTMVLLAILAVRMPRRHAVQWFLVRPPSPQRRTGEWTEVRIGAENLIAWFRTRPMLSAWITFLGLFLLFQHQYHNVPVYHDARLWWAAADQFSSELWFPFIRNYDAGHPPLVAWLLAVLWKVLPVGPVAAMHLLSWSAAALFLTSVFLVARHCFGNTVGVLTAVLTFLHPTVFGQAIQLNLDLYLAAFSWLAIYAVARESRSLLAVACILAVLSKLNGMFALGPFFLYATWNLWKERALIRPGRILAWTWPMLLALAVFAAYHAIKYRAVGHLFDTGEFESGGQLSVTFNPVDYGFRLFNSSRLMIHHNGNWYAIWALLLGLGGALWAWRHGGMRDTITAWRKPLSPFPSDDRPWSRCTSMGILALAWLTLVVQIALQSLRQVLAIERYFLVCYPVIFLTALALLHAAWPRQRLFMLSWTMALISAIFVLKWNPAHVRNLGEVLRRRVAYPPVNVGTNLEINVSFADQLEPLQRVAHYLLEKFPEGAHYRAPWPFDAYFADPRHGVTWKAHRWWRNSPEEPYQVIIIPSLEHHGKKPWDLPSDLIPGYRQATYFEKGEAWFAVYLQEEPVSADP